jgi:hypothetical protein
MFSKMIDLSLLKSERNAGIISTVVTLFISIVVLEVITRNVLFEQNIPSSPSKLDVTEYDPEYGWRLKPNYVGQANQDSSPRLIYHINENGFRGAAIQADTWSKDTIRIIFLGGTNGFGLDVVEFETIPKIIETNLARKLPNLHIEIINFSVPGHGFDQQLMKLEKEGIRYVPDIVVKLFDTDNIYSITYPAHRFIDTATVTDYSKPFYTLQTLNKASNKTLVLNNFPPVESLSEDLLNTWEREFIPSTFLGFIGRYLKVAKYIDSSLNFINTEHYFGKSEIYPEYSSSSDSMLLLVHLIAEFQKNIKEQNAREVFVVIPSIDNFIYNNIHPAAHLSLKKTCQITKLSCIDLLNEFIENDGKALFVSNKRHLNSQGHKVVANAIDEHIYKLVQSISLSRR